MKVREIAAVLDAIAPPALAEDWDNVGLLIGDADAPADKLMLCIDLTGAVLAEASRARVKMVMAYHPPIFRSVARVTADDTPAVYRAAAAGLAVYSTHTALDVAPGGTNDVLAGVLGIVDAAPIAQAVRAGEYKLVVFAPPANLSAVAGAAFAAGAGTIGREYEHCSFFTHGIGTFKGSAKSNPTIGRPGHEEAVEELRLELIVPRGRIAAVVAAVRAAHCYEEPAIDVLPLTDVPAGVGMGRIGRLARPSSTDALVRRVKKAVGIDKVLLARSAENMGTGTSRPRHARPRLSQSPYSGQECMPGKVAVAACAAGSAGSLYKSAAAAGATFYLTGEMRHHDALAATAAGLDVVCLGHSNSERIALTALADRLRKDLPALKVVLSAADRDPFEIV
jgi:dinuclear metal center YbgI/SA1388 family protein